MSSFSPSKQRAASWQKRNQTRTGRAHLNSTTKCTCRGSPVRNLKTSELTVLIKQERNLKSIYTRSNETINLTRLNLIAFY